MEYKSHQVFDRISIEEHLRPLIGSILVHAGDEFSQVDGTYSLDTDEFVVTDGITSSWLEVCEQARQLTGICAIFAPHVDIATYQTEIVGATYAIFGKAHTESQYMLELLAVDVSENMSEKDIRELIVTIRKHIERLKDHFPVMCYQLKEYRGTDPDVVIPNHSEL